MSFRPITDVWILARSKVKYFGAYPAGFLQRARDLLGVTLGDQVLHVCSGKVRDYPYSGFGTWDVTMDLDPAFSQKEHDVPLHLELDAGKAESYKTAIEAHPQIQAVLADPAYTREFATHYAPGADAYVSPDFIVNHALRILPLGGRVGILSLHWPRYPKAIARQIAIVGVTVGNGNLGRWYAVYERTK